MAIQTLNIKDQATQAMKLSPAPFIPAMSFPISNETGLDIKVTIDGKNIRIQKQ
ncbi:MAG: hypothetical protein O2783_02065 [Chloroflexi bacterium]|nr:hypothetical protein [Chloroflexota bacterium]